MKTNTVEKQPLTENIIKKVALRFLRQYYKFRLRYDDQPVTASYDLEGVGGIIADGYYSFKKADGRLFTATFEATGRDSKDEVLYKPQRKLLLWDSLAVASILTLVVVVANYFREFHVLDERTILARTSLLLLSMVISMGVYYLIAKNFRRYRYIYAVEQFKRYYADEQWIALAEDVFDNPDDKYFQELKYQSVMNGIGIVLVNQNLDTKILVTPSRQDIFQGKRKQVDFLPKKLVQQQQVVRQFDAKWALTKSWLPNFLKKEKGLSRFERSYHTQLAVVIGSFVLIGLIHIKEMSRSGYKIVEPEEYREDIAQSKSNGVPEPPEVVGDSMVAENYPNPDKEEFNRSIWKAPKKIKAQKDRSKPKPSSALPRKEKIIPIDTTEIVVADDEKFIAYDCARYYTFDTYKFVVVEGTYKSWPAASRRLALIRNNRIPAAALNKHCFFPGQRGFIIYLGEIFNSPEEASQYIARLDSMPQSLIKNPQELPIKKLPPPGQKRGGG